MKNRVYVVVIDKDFLKNLEEATSKFREGEEIVSQVVADNKLVIATKEDAGPKYGRPKNLLLEEIKR